MLSEDVKIKFSGFEPSHDVRSSLYYLLNRLHLKSPHQSFLSATFTLTNGIIEGVIKISSGTGNFVAKASDVQMSQVGEKLMDKIGGQLDKWKSLRCF
ncbi:MAG: hypothetical protein HC883_01290 [Bdellovibrionaceae bacterium]|nr:hypothetical protein [Pseudobdellovibrionaceae bacterium]